MAFNNENYYPFQDPRVQSQYSRPQHQQYQQQSQHPGFSPQTVQVQIPKIPQYDGTALQSTQYAGSYPNAQYQHRHLLQQQRNNECQQPQTPRQPQERKPSKSSPSLVSSKGGHKHAATADSKPSLPKLVSPAKPAQAEKVKPKPKEIELDYALLLIDLAEEYFGAAYGRIHSDSKTKDDPNQDPDQFYKLVATGLVCLEVVLKYNMQHLLARISYATNSRAASKFLDAAIKVAEAEQHISWLYAFRFLRVSKALDVNSTQESLAAFALLKVIMNTASSRGDVAIVATACATEALAHVSHSRSSESIEQAQTALATIRSAQMSSVTAQVPNLTIMAHFVDVMCSLFRDEFDMAVTKMTAMHVSLEELRENSSWTADGTFRVPLSRPATKAGGSSHGIVLTDQSGRSFLQVRWLPKDVIYTLGYMLSAAVTMAKNPQERMAERFLKEAMGGSLEYHGWCDIGELIHLVQLGDPTKMDTTRMEHNWRHPLRCQAQISLVFALCGRSAWGEAKKELTSLKEMAIELEEQANSSTIVFILYLEGMILQGTGDTMGALSIYTNPRLATNPDAPQP
ncbi:MAG: hypothetical protein LQ340_007569, partial [Diploschistes diacapsis]